MALVLHGRQDDVAAGARAERVAVRVVAQDVVDLHLGAVDRPVLGVGHVDLDPDGVAELEERAVGRQLDLDDRPGVADRDDRGGHTGAAGGVGDGQPGVVHAVGRVDERRVGLGRVDGAVVLEVPGVADDRVTRVGVPRALAGERHRQRCDTRVGRRGGRRRRRAGSFVDRVDLVDGGVLVAGEVAAVAVVEDVERAVGTELHVHRGVERHGVEERVDAGHVALGVHGDVADPAARPLTGEEVVVEVLGELHVRLEVGVEVVDRSGHRALAAAAELVGGDAVVGDVAAVVLDPGRLGPRQVGEARVVRAVVDRRRAVELRAGRVGREVPVVVGLGRGVGAGAVGPAEVAGLADLVELHDAAGAAVGVRPAGVRAVLTEVDVAGALVDGHPERVAEAHRVDLGAGLPLGVGRLGEEVAVRDRVRRRGGVGRDPQDLAAQVVAVGRAALGVVGGVARGALVERRVAVGGERVRVVARRQVEVAVGVEVDGATGVAADAAVGLDAQRAPARSSGRGRRRPSSSGSARCSPPTPRTCAAVPSLGASPAGVSSGGA